MSDGQRLCRYHPTEYIHAQHATSIAIDCIEYADTMDQIGQ